MQTRTAEIAVYIPNGRRTGYIFDVRYRGQLLATAPHDDTQAAALAAAIRQAAALGFTHYHLPGKPAERINGDGRRIGRLERDRQERFNLKRGWHVTAWRIVDADGRDMVQPWPNTKGEARALAAQIGITLIGDGHAR